MSASPIHVACSADENYAPHCAAMLHSLLSFNPPQHVAIHFLHGPRLHHSVLDGLAHVVRGMGASLDFIEIEDAYVCGLQLRGQVAGVMWYRLFLTERMPQLERILYLDADLLVLESLRPLWDTELGDDYAAGVANIFEPRLAHRPRELGLPTAADYFNSGVLLMNLAAMRRDDVPDKVLHIARTYAGRLMWQDQDPLNIAFAGRWRRLHPRWNCQNSLLLTDHGAGSYSAVAIAEARARPAIVHFEGPDQVKPWHYLSKHPYRAAYLEHRGQTPWWEFTPVGRTLKNRLLRPLPVKAMLIISDRLYRARSRARRLYASLRNAGAEV